MKDNITNGKPPIILNFDKVWRILPFKRPKKEILKCILFSIFPFLFKRFAVFQNWKNARAFKDKTFSFWSLKFWQRSFSKSYVIRVHSEKTNEISSNPNPKLAIAIHAFYPEIFSEILQMIEKSEYKNISLYVTTPSDVSKSIEELLNKSSFPFQIMNVENRGRDVLPFLKILPKIFDDGNELVLKIHTKKSNHLNRKDLWSNDLFNKLIGDGAIDKVINIFKKNHNIGIIGPAKHILPMYYYYGANALTVILLSNRMGVKKSDLSNLNFVAGSMFYATKEALLPILQLGLKEENFEIEKKQTDGTMAHAVERAFSAALLVNNLQLADTEYNNNNPILLISKAHHFTI
jgi:lipopolysaccharide biosynthesis protein